MAVVIGVGLARLEAESSTRRSGEDICILVVGGSAVMVISLSGLSVSRLDQ